MGRFHAKALRDLGYFVTTVDPHATADMKRVPSLKGYEVAAIATPPALLGFYGVDCANAGLKTLIEKPVAPSLRQVEAIDAAISADADVCVGFVERFNPVVRRLKEDLPRMGEIWVAKFRRSGRPSDDPIVDIRIHDVDLVHFLGLQCHVNFVTLAEGPKERRINIRTADGTVTCNLMGHNTSPLHALWHAFLSGQDVPRIEDALRAHRALGTPAEALA
jgi:predicted dehydrogenase